MRRRRLKLNPLSPREQAIRLSRVALPIVDEMITEYSNTLNDMGEDDLAFMLDRDWRYGDGVVRDERELQTIEDVSLSLKSALSPLVNAVRSAPSHLQFDVLAEFRERMQEMPLEALRPSIPARREIEEIEQDVEQTLQRERRLQKEDPSNRYRKRPSRWKRKKRQTRAARALGYGVVGGRYLCAEETDWRCLAPEPNREEKCASVWGVDNPDMGEDFDVYLEDTLYAKEPKWWVDFGRYPEPDPDEDLYPWLLLAKKYDFRSLPDYFTPALREKVEDWLRSRDPSRKSLERKLPRFVSTLPSEYDFSDRPVPDFIRVAGGRHVKNEIELLDMGRRNGWCFGSTHYGWYLDQIARGYTNLYFIPHREGIIALYGTFDEDEDSVLEISTESGTFFVLEAKFPQNKEAVSTIDALDRLYKDILYYDLPGAPEPFLPIPAYFEEEGYEYHKNPRRRRRRLNRRRRRS